MSVTIKDIAKVVGVASQNVSGVLNENPRCRVSPATREKILKTARELGYCRNISAKILRGEDTHTVAILSSIRITCITDEHLLRIIMGLLSRFNEEHYACFFAEVCTPGNDNLATVKELVSRGVRSFVIIGSICNSDEIETFLKQSGCSFIQHTGVSERHATISMKMAVHELWQRIPESRRRNFKLLTDPGLEENIRMDAFRSLGCDLSPILFPIELILTKSREAEQLYVENGYRSTEELIRRHPDTKIVMYHSDYYMEGGLRYFHEHGFEIGKDIHLIGVNYSASVRSSLFPLWSIRHPEEELIEFLYHQVRRKEPVNQIFEMQLRKNPAAERLEKNGRIRLYEE